MPLSRVWPGFISSLAYKYWPWSINWYHYTPLNCDSCLSCLLSGPQLGSETSWNCQGNPLSCRPPTVSQGKMGCLHQPNSLIFGTSSKKKRSPLYFNLVSSLGKRKVFQTSSTLAVMIKSRLDAFGMKEKDLIPGSKSHMEVKGLLWTQQNGVWLVLKEVLLLEELTGLHYL